jgi:hypothetical protein
MSIPLGCYRVWWKSGGSSVATIYQDSEGKPWIAPSNWVVPAKLENYTDEIQHFKRLDGRSDKYVIPSFKDIQKELENEFLELHHPIISGIIAGIKIAIERKQEKLAVETDMKECDIWRLSAVFNNRGYYTYIEDGTTLVFTELR